ncbi:MAG: PP2C family serine/threonine-protein phosphatase [Terriglobia bacterium]
MIGRGEIPFAALCDGAGNAQQAAKKVLGLFEKLFKEASPQQVAVESTWANWIRLLDSSLLGGSQSTFVGIAVVNGLAVGASAGDSRAYILSREGDCRILTEGAKKSRLGSGQAEAFPIRQPLTTGNILLLLTDGAWTPLGPYLLKKALVSAAGSHFSEVSQAIIEAAGRTGRPDDMTAVTLRLAR